MDCIFCKITKKEVSSDIIYEDNNFFAFLDINPVNTGHTLLIPKKHYQNLYDIPDEILKETAPIVKKIAVALKQTLKSDGINIIMNNDAPAGQVILHAHFHIIPRFLNDGHKHWKGTSISKEKSAETASQIREFFTSKPK